LQRKKPSGTKSKSAGSARTLASKKSAAAHTSKGAARRNEPRRKPSPLPGQPRPLTAARGGGDLSERVNDVARTRRLQESREVAEAAIEAALEKQALLPVLIDVSARATYTDFIGIVSGKNDRQVDAIAEHVARTLGERGWQLLSREGTGNGRWTLLDFGDIVVHVFYHPVREFYDIESLWIDAPRVKLTVPPEATQLREEALFYERP
jgi:ribosome-associated protein